MFFKTKQVWTEWEAVDYSKDKQEGEKKLKDWLSWDTYAEFITKTKVEREYKLTDGVLP